MRISFFKKFKQSKNDSEEKEQEKNNQKQEIDNEENKKDEDVKENKKTYSKKYISKKIKFVISSFIIFFVIIIFLNITLHLTKFKGNYVYLIMALNILMLILSTFFTLKWYFKSDENEMDEEIQSENEDIESSEEIEENKENEEGEEILIGSKRKRILINDDSWKEFRIPQAQGNPFNDYSTLGSSFFIDLTNWDVHTLMKELEMFDPELKNDFYYRHKVEIFMKVNDRDYRYPRVSQKEMFKPEEILSIQMDSTEIEREEEDEEDEETEGDEE